MTGDRTVRLDDVRQEVKIAFHEQGVNVVAINTSLGVLESVPPEPQHRLHADRPFVFVIQDESGLILAAGMVARRLITRSCSSDCSQITAACLSLIAE